MGHGASASVKKSRVQLDDLPENGEILWANRSNSDGCIVETLNSSKTKVELLEQQVDEYRDLLQSAEEELEKVQQEAEKYKNQLVVAESAKLDLTDRIEELEDQLNSLQSQIDSDSTQELSRALHEKDQEIETLHVNLEKLSGDISTVKTKYRERLKSMKSALVETKQEQSMKIYQMKEEIKALEDENSKLLGSCRCKSVASADLQDSIPSDTEEQTSNDVDPRNNLIVELSNQVNQQEVLIEELKEQLRQKDELLKSRTLDEKLNKRIISNHHSSTAEHDVRVKRKHVKSGRSSSAQERTSHYDLSHTGDSRSVLRHGSADAVRGMAAARQTDRHGTSLREHHQSDVLGTSSGTKVKHKNEDLSVSIVEDEDSIRRGNAITPVSDNVNICGSSDNLRKGRTRKSTKRRSQPLPPVTVDMYACGNRDHVLDFDGRNDSFETG